MREQTVTQFHSPVNRQERKSESAMPEKATACVTVPLSLPIRRTGAHRLVSVDQNAGAE